jgi:RNA polymerase sigma-70 factor, ECF subfamily
VICHILFEVGLFAPKPAPLASAGESAPDPLWARAAQGDRAAFVALYREHFASVHSFAQRLLGCPVTADDLTHDVFLGLPRALERFRGQCPLSSYILSITVRRARQHLRAAKRRRLLEARAAEAAATAQLSSTPDADTDRRELGARLTRALDALPLAQRAAFVLCEVEERSSAEAAEILGEKAGTVRARVFKAKRRLRAGLVELVPERLANAIEVES